MLWVRIMIYLLQMILEGMSEKEAATKASTLFNVSVDEILRHL